MVLGAMVSGEWQAAEIAAAWKLSSEETTDAVLAARTLADFTEDEHYWLSKAVDMQDPIKLVPSLRMNRLKEAADAIEAGVPEFPLMGRDLIAAGMKPGPDLGRTLAELRQEWKDSRFAMDKDALLAMADKGDLRR
jgi:tRNA nucleotidyltransferase/poly(A) polymerase